MAKVRYDYITTHETYLARELSAMNKSQDKIVSVTQNGEFYTIFYEEHGNAEDGEC